MRGLALKHRRGDQRGIASSGKWTLFLVAAAFGSTQSQIAHAGHAVTASQTIEQVTLVGQSSIHSTPIGSGAVAAPETADEQDTGVKALAVRSFARRSGLPIPSKEAARLGLAALTLKKDSEGNVTLPLPEPVVHRSKVSSEQAEGFSGFDGLSHIDQRTANSGNQFSIEPPDQGLCAGNGYVMETVNDVIRVFDGSGQPLSPVLDMNSFFGLAPAIDRAHGNVRGPFLSDPRCFYDAQTRRWFVTELMEDQGGNVGATHRNYNLIAVSQSADPTGEFTVFQYDVTDDGQNQTPSHPGCPCIGDQPLFGFDQFGVYQSTNEFGAQTFNGAQVYAISKPALIAAANSEGPLPAVVHIDASGALVPFGGLSYTIQPAVAPAAPGGDKKDGAGNGVEYFLSALQFGNPGYEVYDNRIAVWALTNTRSLGTNSPSLALSFDVVQGETYGQPDNADQKAGPTPLGTAAGQPLEQLQTNDDRMNQVVYVGGLLYGAVNSKLSVAGASQTGAAWFAVKPSFEQEEDPSTLKGEIAHQGYVAVAGNNVIFPSIALTNGGNGVMTFSLVGADYFPSAAYVLMEGGDQSSSVHVAGMGLGPEDGFSGIGTGAARWGDYSAATTDGNSIWFAAEYIPRACTTNALPCRTANANWGTFVGSLRP